MNYLKVERITAKKETAVPRSGSHNSYGYGSKIPTSLMVQLDGKRWRRVYFVCWSNAGTAYVVEKGQNVYIAGGDI